MTSPKAPLREVFVVTNKNNTQKFSIQDFCETRELAELVCKENDDIYVMREVSPAHDLAVKQLVEALKRLRGNDFTNPYGLQYHADILEALDSTGILKALANLEAHE